MKQSPRNSPVSDSNQPLRMVAKGADRTKQEFDAPDMVSSGTPSPQSIGYLRSRQVALMKLALLRGEHAKPETQSE